MKASRSSLVMILGIVSFIASIGPNPAAADGTAPDLLSKFQTAVDCPRQWNGDQNYTGSCGQTVTDACGKVYNCSNTSRPLCDKEGGCTCQYYSRCP